MSEQDISSLQKKFVDIVGMQATAEISEEGATESAAVIIELDELVKLGKSMPSDLFLATIATSQLLEWSQQLHQHHYAGSIPSIEDTETLVEVKAKLSQGHLSKDETNRLLRIQYVADPDLGAKKAMELFEKLYTKHGGFEKVKT